MAKRGDTIVWTFTATDGNPPSPVNLTSATAIRLRGQRVGQTFIDTPVTGNAAGVLVYPPTPEDVAIAADLRFELKVTWQDGKVQTFPARGQAAISLEPDIPEP